MLDVTIKEIEDEKELLKFKGFILKQPQFYGEKEFKEWVNYKCIARIESNNYKNIIAIHNNLVIGDAVYRSLDEYNIEIKNFRIDPKLRNRDLGHFILTQIQKDNPKKIIKTDTTVDNYPMIEFLVRNGFNITDKKELYFEGQDEYILEKNQYNKNIL